MTNKKKSLPSELLPLGASIMSSINVFTIIGNITKDVQLKHVANGTATATYVVAVDDSYVDRDGNKHERCDFIPVTTYGKQAEADAKYLKKGATVAVSGSIRSWYKEQKGGFNFEVDKVKYLSKGNGSRGAEQDQSQSNIPDNTPASEHDQWVQEYANAENNQQQGPAGSSRK
jgi:single-strand DNA-binding protein